MLVQPYKNALSDVESINKSKKPLKVLIVHPPDKHAVKAMWVFDENEESKRGYRPPLAPLYLASYIKEKSDHDVRILDCQLMQLDEEGIKKQIKEYGPDVLGVSAWTDYWYDSLRIAQLAKGYDPGIHVCIGGPHVAIYPHETLDQEAVDSIVVGDGEVPFLWLINGLSNDNIPGNLPGLHLKKHGVKSGDYKFYIQNDLDVLSIPDRELLPYKMYQSVVTKRSYVTTMITSRGCPNRCTFCKLNFQKTISRSSENVLNELDHIANLGIREIEIYDDTFTWSKKRVIEICQGIIDRGYDFDWAIRDRVNKVDDETLHWLSQAGCQRIHLGIESGSEATLQKIKKNITREQASRAVRLIKKSGLEVLTFFMIGLPGETVDEMRETIKFAISLDPHYAAFSVTIPYPGTELYKQGLKSGIIPRDHWIEYARNPTPNYMMPYFWEEHLNQDELLKIRNEALRKFYFRPKYIFKQFANTSNRKELSRKSLMAYGLLKSTFSVKSLYKKIT